MFLNLASQYLTASDQSVASLWFASLDLFLVLFDTFVDENFDRKFSFIPYFSSSSLLYVRPNGRWPELRSWLASCWG